MDFFDRVKARAHALGRNISEIVVAAGMKYEAYNTQRKSKNLPRADDAVKIAAQLGTTVEWLVTGVQQPTCPRRLLTMMADAEYLSNADVEEVHAIVKIKKSRIVKGL